MESWDQITVDELTHWGIKGQKWGKRRFQYEDGTLTPAGKLRYDDDPTNDNHTPNEATKVTTKKQKEYKIPETKSKHRLNLEDKYKSQGLSEKEAEQAAAKRIRAEQYTAAAAAVTVASCVAYCKYKGYTKDKVYGEGTEFQRIMALNKDQPIHEGRQYLAINKADKLKYKGVYAKELAGNEPGKDLYNVTVKAKQDIKVASRKSAQDAFKELYDTDKDFREGLKNRTHDMGRHYMADKEFGKAFEKVYNGQPMSKKEYNKFYDLFNQRIIDDHETNEKFYKKLAAKGYNAIQDRNDQKYSGYNTKNPLITFDGKYDYIKTKMSDEQIKKDVIKGQALINGPEMAKYGSLTVGSFVGMNSYNNSLVRQYKQEHPGTKMTDKEIKEMLKREGKLLTIS